ncbi:MAG: class I SAM-dependent methyltransferase [Pseudomonadota bacterium]
MTKTEDPRFADYESHAELALSHETEALNDVSRSLLMLERSAQALTRVLEATERDAINQPAIAKALKETEFDPIAYAHIAYDLREFLLVLMDLDAILAADSDYAHSQFRYRPVRFLEVGCGPGRNLYVVRNSGMLLWKSVEGFDIIGPYIEAANATFQLGDAVWQDDARSFDFGGYDVVFSYRPFVNPEVEAEYENRLVESMNTGAYLISPLNETHNQDTRLVAFGETNVIWKRL